MSRAHLPSNRLLTGQIPEHLEVMKLPSPRPIIVIGFGRMGTTLLQNSLAQDPAGLVFGSHYRQLVAAPIGMVRQICDHFGYGRGDKFEKGARKCLEEYQEPERKKRFPDLDQFGLEFAGGEGLHVSRGAVSNRTGPGNAPPGEGPLLALFHSHRRTRNRRKPV